MILLLAHFSIFFKTSDCPLPSYYEIFDLPGYLRSFSVNDRPFMEELAGTMLFSKFIEDAWQTTKGRNWEEKKKRKEKENRREQEEMRKEQNEMRRNEEERRRRENEKKENEKSDGSREEEEGVMDEITAFKRDWRVLKEEGMKEVEEKQEEKMREILERNKNV